MSIRQTLFAILLTAWMQLSTHRLRKSAFVWQHREKTGRAAWSLQRCYNLAVRLGLRILGDTRGQDMIEYALMAGLVTLAAIAAVPGIATSISTVFSKVASTMTAAASTS